MSKAPKLVSWTPYTSVGDTIGVGVDEHGRVFKLVDLWDDDDGVFAGARRGTMWVAVTLPPLPGVKT